MSKKKITTEELQKKVDEVFTENFGYTPFKERMSDIQREFFELIKWNDINNLKEETGYLLATIIKLCAESKWDFSELVMETLTKINSRSEQYKTLGRKVKVAIYGTAANPIHLGHLQVAQFVLNTSGEFDEVWILPAFKHMYHKNMVSPEHRLEMCKLAVEVDKRIKVFDYEIKNQLAGETYNLFKRLKEEKELTEKYQFSMIIGLDNANTFDKWVNFEELERMVRFVVVPRAGIERNNSDWYLKPPHIFLNNENTGIIDTSSTEIRKLLKKWKNSTDDEKIKINSQLEYLLGINVFEYIQKNNLYMD